MALASLAAGRWCLRASVDTSVSKKKKNGGKKKLQKTQKKCCLSLVSIASHAQPRQQGAQSFAQWGKKKRCNLPKKKKAELPTDWLTATSVVIGCRLWREYLEEAQGGISSGRFSFSRAPFVTDSRVDALAVLSQTLATYCSKKSLHNYIILKLPPRIPVSLSPNSSK